MVEAAERETGNDGQDEAGSGTAGELTADEFLQPGDEDFNEDILSESVEDTLKRTKAAQEDFEKEHSGDKSKKAQKTNDQEQVEQIEPPQRVTSDFREWFKKAPPEAQREFNKIVQDLENGQRNKLREIAEYRQTVEPVFQALSPWAKEWAERGVSLPQGVALLAKTHERMVQNPAQEIARLITDNDITLEQVQNYLNGTGDSDPSSRESQREIDITKHPEFVSLREQLKSITTEREEARIKSETDKVVALRDEVDANGNKPFERILDSSFLQYAQPLVTALRTPPRGPDGKFVGGPQMSLVDAYKRAYKVWATENGIFPQNQATSHQPEGAQPQVKRKPSEPISMRPRSAPASGIPASSEDVSKYLGESVEDTMRRIRAQMSA